jgi:hypothetical protein
MNNQLRKTTNLVSLICIVVALSGCRSTPEQRAAKEHRRAVEREADERRNQEEEKRDAIQREANEAQDRRQAIEELRRKFVRYSTPELKIMDARYRDLNTSSGRDLNLTVNRGLLQRKANSDETNIERVLEIERELLRRWKAGDNEAFLAEFQSLAPVGSK